MTPLPHRSAAYVGLALVAVACVTASGQTVTVPLAASAWEATGSVRSESYQGDRLRGDRDRRRLGVRCEARQSRETHP